MFLKVLILLALATNRKRAVKEVLFKCISHKDVQRGGQAEVPCSWPYHEKEFVLETSWFSTISYYPVREGSLNFQAHFTANNVVLFSGCTAFSLASYDHIIFMLNMLLLTLPPTFLYLKVTKFSHPMYFCFTFNLRNSAENYFGLFPNTPTQLMRFIQRWTWQVCVLKGYRSKMLCKRL